MIWNRVKPIIALEATEVRRVSDETLVERIANGEVRAFEELIQRYQTPALRFAFRLVGDLHEAEDLAQEAFLRVYRNAQRYNYAARFRTWFFQILVNLCRDWLKKKKPLFFGEPPQVAAGAPDPSQAMEREWRAKAVERAVQSLPPQQRMALVLCHFEEMSYREAAAVLATSEKAVESLLVRARRTLRVRLLEFR
ncbi:MAG TPA: sigma-70 family RNA polymerase sigma factor [Bryobacteraceae bacterium]|nr:sigma-70 family RNA polymerase sigma factor [Bryobacteraceae bacterium]